MTTVEPMSFPHEAVDLPVEGQRIRGTLIVPEVGAASAPAALFVHGWGGSQAESLGAARAVAALGFICLIFDLRGHAGTLALRDTVTREENLRDVVTAYDVLANRVGVDRSRILMAGSSYGAYLGAIATGLRPLRWLSMQAPAIYKDAGWNLPKCKLHCDPDFDGFLRRALRPADNRALEAGERFRGDALIVESGNDTTMPHPVAASYVGAFANAHSLTHRIIEGADHGLSRETWKAAYIESLVRWLKETTAKATVG
jgi:pimeloyl-ACP methyl ester carboxylesterase